MEDLESRMNGILNDPEMMQKIMAMAQSLQNAQQEAPPEVPAQEGFSMPEMDMGMLQKLAGLASQSGVDKNQKSLLNALGPYLSQHRVGKLEKAMKAAKMARLASSFIGQSGSLFGIGR